MLSEPVVVSAPTALPITIDAVRTYLRIDGNDLDDEIQRQLKAAIAQIEKTTATRLAPQTVEILADHFTEFQRFDIAPVTSVIALRYVSPAGNEVTLPSNAYALTGAGLTRGLRPAIGGAWPATAAIPGAVTIRLEVGYAGGAIPPNVELAMLEYVRALSDGVAPDVASFLADDRLW